MDDDFDVLLDCDCYGRGFIFSCTLCEDSNHRQDGYEIKIIVHAASSDLWCDEMILSLISERLKPLKPY